MYQDKRIAVIIAAAGSGTRMGSGISKQFLKIGEEMVIEKTLRAFSSHPFIDDIYLVVKKEEMDFCRKELLKKKKPPKMRAIVSGGKERQDSISHALSVIVGLQKQGRKNPDGKPIPTARFATDYVLVHDGARPFVSAAAISRLVEGAVAHEAATLGVPVKDTIKRVGGQWLEETLDRSTLFSIQTPQGFEFKLLLAAHKKAKEDEFHGTDDAVLVERMGKRVYLVKGEYSNIKITTRDDLQMFPEVCKGRDPAPEYKEWRSGTGFDVHAFAPDRELILGGTRIPYSQGLLGHSDADVLTHGVIDALLGACGLGDIGIHFPDTDVQYKDISSLDLLTHVKGFIIAAGYKISNIDVTVIAEKPKVAAYIKEMKSNLADALGIDETQINIKGTTTEQLGFCGREEGIAVSAIATVYQE